MAEAESLRRGMILPPIVLPDVSGKATGTAGYRGRCNLVLFLSHPPGCEPCEGMLRELAAGYGGLAAADAEVLAIVPGTEDETAILQLRLGIPFPVLVDAGATTVRCLGGGAAVIVVDRFGEIFNLSRAGEGHELISVLEIADWLNFIEVQCPECGAPDWPGQAL